MRFEMFRARSGGMGGGNPPKHEYHPPDNWRPRVIKSGGGTVIHIASLEEAESLAEKPTPTKPTDVTAITEKKMENGTT